MKKINFIKLKMIKNINGLLLVFEKYKRFNIKRIFSITAKKNSLRGQHAHKKCNQILIVPQGKIEVNLTNGKLKKKIILNSSSKALHIKPMIWASQKFLLSNSVLLVICDQNYSENDYIRKFEKYLKIKNNDKKNSN
tara:strand:+ start:404 stop:814 length:411 start_codon:yes stop_codon:yes gene_type:complete